MFSHLGEIAKSSTHQTDPYPNDKGPNSPSHCLNAGRSSFPQHMSLRDHWFKIRNEPNALPRHLARRFLFGLFERLGLHITGDHFYEPIPNLRDLEATYDGTPRSIPGHDLSIARFETAHAQRLQAYATEFESAAAKFGYDPTNYFFRGADALSWHSLLREIKPATVVEIGQGVSTRIAIAALEMNAADGAPPATLLSIDPHPRLRDDTLHPEHTKLEQIHQPIQSMPKDDLLARLGPNTVLFVDSSHVHKHGSDVWHLMREIYPGLPSGTLLHIHDIVLPYPWPKEFYTEQKWFWNEQDMLAAFLAFNTAFEIILPVHLVHRDSALVHSTLASILPDFPQADLGYSFYLRRL